MTTRIRTAGRTIYRLMYAVASSGPTSRSRDDHGWPICAGCGQSSTGMYGGKVRCVRCEPASARR